MSFHTEDSPPQLGIIHSTIAVAEKVCSGTSESAAGHRASGWQVSTGKAPKIGWEA